MASGIVLASGSPRRLELLRQLGVPFTVQVSEVDEGVDGKLDPATIVLALASRKAEAVATRAPDAVVVGADTEVFVEGERFGKPGSPEAARAMLTRLSGREHTVLSAVAVAGDGSVVHREVVESRVTFRELTADEIDHYVATGEPMDRAGSYAIQGIGRDLIEGVEGCFTNVVGLPLCATARLLIAAGVEQTWVDPACRLEDGRSCPNLVR